MKNMILTAQVLPAMYSNTDRWEAVLVIDGTPTTFECGHLHHSHKTAWKCLQSVLDRAVNIVNDPTFVSRDIDTSKYGQPDGLVEWEVTRMTDPSTSRFNLPSSPQICTTRLWMHRNFS